MLQSNVSFITLHMSLIIQMLLQSFAAFFHLIFSVYFLTPMSYTHVDLIFEVFKCFKFDFYCNFKSECEYFT